MGPNTQVRHGDSMYARAMVLGHAWRWQTFMRQGAEYMYCSCGIGQPRASLCDLLIPSGYIRHSVLQQQFRLRQGAGYLDEAPFDGGSSTYRAEPKAAVRHVLVQAVCMEPLYTAIA
jgi:hypothetical protein